VNSLHCGVIAFILLVPWAILVVVIVGQLLTTWVRWIRCASFPALAHARLIRLFLPQVSDGKTTHA
jgi:hypothetical protein